MSNQEKVEKVMSALSEVFESHDYEMNKVQEAVNLNHLEIQKLRTKLDIFEKGYQSIGENSGIVTKYYFNGRELKGKIIPSVYGTHYEPSVQEIEDIIKGNMYMFYNSLLESTKRSAKIVLIKRFREDCKPHFGLSCTLLFAKNTIESMFDFESGV